MNGPFHTSMFVQDELSPNSRIHKQLKGVKIVGWLPYT